MKCNLWSDCNGGIITTELLLVSSVVVAAVLAALGTFKQTITSEFQHLGESVKAVHNPEPVIQAAPIETEANALGEDVFFPHELISKQG